MFSEIKLIENLLTESAHRLRSIKLALKASEITTPANPLPKRIRFRKKEEEREYQYLIEDLNEVLSEVLREKLIFFRSQESLKKVSIQLLNPSSDAPAPGLKVSESLALLAQGRPVVSEN